VTSKILVTNPIHAEVLSRLTAIGEVDMNASSTPWSNAEIRAKAAGSQAMMGFMTDCVDTHLLAAAPDLRVIAAALKGFDSYDVAACSEAGVWFCIVPDLLTEPTAELAIGLAISLARHVRHGDAYVRSGAFNGWRSNYFGTGLRQATVAVIGLGQVGSAIIDRLAGFECAEIYGVDPAATHPQAVSCDLTSALERADFIFVAAPLTPTSTRLLNTDALAITKRGALIINVGRGSVVDEQSVLHALRAGTIGGYAADVFACEDWSLAERPTAIDPALLAHPQTLFTPHLGSAVRTVRLAIEHRAADNIIAVLQGQPPPDAINVLLKHRVRMATLARAHY
jgi:phosphonate dehydrogenase